MYRIKKQKGITLVALVITIIVLLILAVVAIGAVRDSGIIGHAQNSADRYNTGKADEDTKIGEYEDAISKYYNSGSFGTSGVGKGSVTYKDGVPIPSGFYYVIGTKDTGFVISDDKADENNANGKSGNQFVWVPVTEDITTSEAAVVSADDDVNNLKIINDKLGTTYSNSNDFLLSLQTDFDEMKESVNHYNGFYVGRYEVSYNSKREAQSKGSAVEPYIYSAKNSTTSSNNNNATNWYGLYALCKTYKTDSVKSSMIWGIQYDKMMNWMGNDATNFDVRNSNVDSNRRTGFGLLDVIRNVYDLAGNSYEWTLEAESNSSRVNRGGSCYARLLPSSRSSRSPIITDNDYGSRLTLYITVGFDNLDEEIEIPEEELGEVPDSMIGEKFGFVGKDDSGKQEHDYYVFNKDYTGKHFNGRYEDPFTFTLESDGTGTLTMDEKNKVYEIAFKVLKDESGNVINKFIIFDDHNEYDNTYVYTTNGSIGLQKLENTRYKIYEDEELMGYFVFDGESVKANPVGTDEMIDMDEFGDYFVYGNYIYMSNEEYNVFCSAFRIEGDTLVSLAN